MQASCRRRSGEYQLLNLADRKKIYQIFSDLFRYPNQLTHADSSKSVVELSKLLSFDLHPDLSQVPGLRDMETAYTHLFINSLGGTPAPPYGSVYLDPAGLMMGETSIKVAAYYAEENLNLQGSDEPPDFLATELEFLYYLLDEEEAALAANDRERQAELVVKQADFFATYLFPWLPVFCERIIASATDSFYLWVAGALQHFCEMEMAIVEKE